MQNFSGQLLVYNIGPQPQHITIIMLAAHFCGRNIVTDSSADARKFIGYNTHSDSGPANKNSSVIVTARNFFRGKHGKIWIVHRISRKSSHIKEFDLPLLKKLFKRVFQLVSSMVTG